ncbi:MAG: cobalamin biosynthesis protein CbiX [Actinomycetota bacterium]|nr:cobalamin biosynthesis protein CbiX [Actinomycetota bacterium]
MSAGPGVRVLLVGGHESAAGAELARFAAPAQRMHVAAPGRGLHDSVSAALDAGESVVVVPMTFGRNPTMVADAAKTLKWLSARHPERIALAASFGQIDHLTAWLRTAANRARATDGDSALLIVAPHSDPFDEAELHRVAYLVSTHGALAEVAVAIADDSESVAASVSRLRRLGVRRIATVPAGFALTVPEADADYVGPLMSDAAVERVIRSRVRDALDALAIGHDGIADGLAADHGHGYAHSHAFEESQRGAQPHAHAHPHSHAHSHSHSQLESDQRQHEHHH